MKVIDKLFNTKNILLIIAVLILAIFFETVQQLFYIKRFNLYEDVVFLDLFKNQFYRWIIWFLFGIPLLFFIKKDIEKEQNKALIVKYACIILILVILNILIIASISYALNEEFFSFSNFFSEYFLFFLFQKSPIYTLGYIAITIILFLNFSKELLQIEVLELIELKKTNEKLYNKFIVSNTDKTQILNIKIGNKRKIIPIEKITFLEADDYCVNVHTVDDFSYSMRISLKSLEDKLDNNFLRVHRKSMVNMKMVKELKLISKPYLLLTNNKKVFISKSNLKVVKNFLDQL